ncbi:hypothetical protein [Helicobacter turcicus]|uniref:hypothetical protein n=1 Tax=Helicobacter turcicus TaxID=2867412 RepID=UPI001C868557|nr:hypothetical protein [Helicobacter turcicus]
MFIFVLGFCLVVAICGSIFGFGFIWAITDYGNMNKKNEFKVLKYFALLPFVIICLKAL